MAPDPVASAVRGWLVEGRVSPQWRNGRASIGTPCRGALHGPDRVKRALAVGNLAEHKAVQSMALCLVWAAFQNCSLEQMLLDSECWCPACPWWLFKNSCAV
jgi:hypothetical protein